jgi:hypothetical protein
MCRHGRALILGPQVLDELLLLAIDQTSEGEKVQLPRFEKESHD